MQDQESATLSGDRADIVVTCRRGRKGRTDVVSVSSFKVTKQQLIFDPRKTDSRKASFILFLLLACQGWSGHVHTWSVGL